MGHLVHGHSVNQEEIVRAVATAHVEPAHKLGAGCDARQLLEYAYEVRAAKGCIAPRKSFRRKTRQAGLCHRGTLLLVRLDYCRFEGVYIRSGEGSERQKSKTEQLYYSTQGLHLQEPRGQEYP